MNVDKLNKSLFAVFSFLNVLPYSLQLLTIFSVRIGSQSFNVPPHMATSCYGALSLSYYLLVISFFLNLPVVHCENTTKSLDPDPPEGRGRATTQVEKVRYPREDDCVTTPEYLEYPWNRAHDKRVNRIDHLHWRWDDTISLCVHIKPGFYPPRTDPNLIRGEECTTALHGDPGFGKWWRFSHGSGHQEYHCLDARIDITELTTHPGYEVYMATEGWANPEHCRAGCETCFDAMHEYGAEEAFCSRMMPRSVHCALGYRRRNNSRALTWWSKTYPERYIYYGMERGRLRDEHGNLMGEDAKGFEIWVADPDDA